MKKKYIIFHKPWGVLSQFTTEGNHRTLAEFGLPKDIYAAGRLDKDSEGLLLLTNDGPFIKQFLDQHSRVYWAQVEGEIKNEDLLHLKTGLKLKDGLTKPCDGKILKNLELPPRDPPIRERKSIPTSWVELVLTEGKNRQVRRMTAHIGYPTLRLIRVKLGKFTIDLFNELPAGSWLEVEKKQIISGF